MRKYIPVLVVSAVIVSMLFSNWFNESNHNPFDYARITEVDYRATVVDEPGGNGKISVTERLTFDIHAASRNNLFWELWRDLPEEYIDGVKVEYQVLSVKQILEDGREIVYPQSPQLYWEDEDYIDTAGGLGPGRWYHSEGPYSEARRQYECVFFYVDGLYRETVVFEIEYEMFNAALRYNDCSELYITPYSEGDIVFLKRFQGQIAVPADRMPRAGNYEAHTYGTNANTFPFTESDTVNPGYHTFAFELDKSQLKFRPYNRYIEFSLISYGQDKHLFTRHASVNDYYYDDVLDELAEEQAKYEAAPGLFRMVKLIVLLLLSAGAVLAVKFAFGIRNRMNKRYHFYEPAWKVDYSRDIPSDLDPSFAAALVFCKQSRPKEAQDGYAGVLLSLARKGYIELAKIREEQDWVFSNVKFIVRYSPAEPQTAPGIEALTPTEELYFNLILRHANGYDLPLSFFQNKVSEDYENTNSFVRNAENALVSIGVSQGYFQKADYRQPAKQVRSWSLTLAITGVLFATVGNIAAYHTRLDFAFGAFFILGAACILSAIHLYRVSPEYVLLTQFGEDEYARWRGLYHFLDSETHLKESGVTDLAAWEQYLVYATAFGISEKIASALTIKCPDAARSHVLRNPYYRSAHFRSSHRSFRSATRTASFRARSGGYGGHGGYGGGGRGGGGGGGGH